MMASENGLTMLEATRLFLGDKWLVTAQLQGQQKLSIKGGLPLGKLAVLGDRS